jgi:hypothetical protein
MFFSIIFKHLLALKEIYPEYATEFTTKARGYWKDRDIHKAFFDQLAIKYNIQKLEDWNKVTTRMVVNEGGSSIIRHYNGSLVQGNY